MAWLRSLREGVRRSWWGRILAEHDTEPTEFGSGLLKLVLGGWLLLPPATIAASSAFSQLSALPEWAVGLALAGIGGGHLAALRVGSRGWRRAAAMLAFSLWFGFALTSVWLNPWSLGFPFFGVLALAQGWAYLRLGRLAP